MKEGIHPEYSDATITCTCGAVYHTRSTRKAIHVEICASCHPFFTGQQKLIDTAGRVEKFKRKYARPSARATASSRGLAQDSAPRPEGKAPPRQDGEGLHKTPAKPTA